MSSAFSRRAPGKWPAPARRSQIILGFIRGMFLGPIKSVDVLLGSAYGLTWLTALGVTIVTYLFGLLVIVPALRRMDRAPVNPNGSATAELASATDRVRRLVGLELT